MNESLGFVGNAMPKPKFVLAPKNRWKAIPVVASVKDDVWAWVKGKKMASNAAWMVTWRDRGKRAMISDNTKMKGRWMEWGWAFCQWGYY